MPKAAKTTASERITMEGFEGGYEKLEGGYTVGFETYDADADAAELFRGLPDDRCQCPHWGVVVRGTLVYRLADGTENVIGAGEAYSVGPGHLPLFMAGTELIEFSPTDEFTKTVDVVMANLAAMTAAGASS